MNELGKAICNALDKSIESKGIAEKGDLAETIKSMLESKTPEVLEQATKEHTDKKLTSFITGKAQGVIGGGGGYVHPQIVMRWAIEFYCTPIKELNKEVKNEEEEQTTEE